MIKCRMVLGSNSLRIYVVVTVDIVFIRRRSSVVLNSAFGHNGIECLAVLLAAFVKCLQNAQHVRMAVAQLRCLRKLFLTPDALRPLSLESTTYRSIGKRSNPVCADGLCFADHLAVHEEVKGGQARMRLSFVHSKRFALGETGGGECLKTTLLSQNQTLQRWHVPRSASI